MISLKHVKAVHPEDGVIYSSIVPGQAILNNVPADKLDVEHANLYFNPGVRKTSFSNNKRGGKLAVEKSYALWVDFDYKDFDSISDFNLRELSSRWIKPSFFVFTGGGVHFYWLLEKPLEDFEEADYWFDYLKSVFPESDHSVLHWDAAMRLPSVDTFNYKYSPPRKVRIIEKRADKISLPPIPSHEELQIRKILTSMGAVQTGYNGGETSYSRPPQDGEICSPTGLVLYAAELSDVGEPILQVYTSGWPELPSGTYKLADLKTVGDPRYKAKPVDPLEQLVANKVIERKISEKANRNLLESRCEELGIVVSDILSNKQLDILIKNREQVLLLEQESGSGLDPKYQLRSMGEIIDSPASAKHWVVEDLIGMGDITAIAAQPKAGKTTLVMTLVSALAEGSSLWGYKVGRPLKVAVLDFEMQAHEIKNQYLVNASDSVRNNVFSLLVGSTEADDRLDLFSSRTRDDLKKMFAEHQIDYLVVDPLLEAVYGTEVDKVSDGDIANQNNVISSFLDAVRDITPSHGSFIVHHTNTEGKFHGAKVLERKPQALWYLSAEDVDVPKDLLIKARSGGYKKLKLLYNLDTNLLDNIPNFG